MREVEASLASHGQDRGPDGGQRETPSCGVCEIQMEGAHSIKTSTLFRNSLAVTAVIEAKAEISVK
ncbi:hypothetical protein K443DRAFT_463351 [Laccaria amethystina LaAM-08-1]|jgi:hypothetical protein|uniref:Uncharacterized protein n=1 Tax=Laccaria amethystina LaAM-08-1 TaxID=1095629 RepID=A0A0C9X6E5_9AGAR|nr:hypothetical protein K443DRAFT_463351 [Laccaria amethystina LaAM-08-1]